MKPLILISNDDGVDSPGLHHLAHVASEFGDVVVVAPDHNASGLGVSITCLQPLRCKLVDASENVSYYACNGTPVDCVMLGKEHVCSRRPDLILSGINYGSNASINVMYSGTMGAVIQGCLDGCQSIGFSLLNHRPDADFAACTKIIQHIISQVLAHPLPIGTGLNVNIPRLPANEIKGIRVCRQAHAQWLNNHEQRIDPVGKPYWWLTGKFVCDDKDGDTDQYWLEQGYVSVVPIRPDLTDYQQLNNLNNLQL